MEKIFDVSYFIDKFEKIPEDKWCTEAWTNGERRCVNGHCGVTQSNRTNNESIALKKVFEPLGYGLDHFKFSYTALEINDGKDINYTQPTPKQRILAALHDIKKLSSEPDVQECDATRMIVVPSAWPNKQSEIANLFPIVDEVSDLKNVKQIQGLSGSKK